VAVYETLAKKYLPYQRHIIWTINLYFAYYTD